MRCSDVGLRHKRTVDARPTGNARTRLRTFFFGPNRALWSARASRGIWHCRYASFARPLTPMLAVRFNFFQTRVTARYCQPHKAGGPVQQPWMAPHSFGVGQRIANSSPPIRASRSPRRHGALTCDGRMGKGSASGYLVSPVHARFIAPTAPHCGRCRLSASGQRGNHQSRRSAKISSERDLPASSASADFEYPRRSQIHGAIVTRHRTLSRLSRIAVPFALAHACIHSAMHGMALPLLVQPLLAIPVVNALHLFERLLGPHRRLSPTVRGSGVIRMDPCFGAPNQFRRETKLDSSSA